MDAVNKVEYDICMKSLNKTGGNIHEAAFVLHNNGFEANGLSLYEAVADFMSSSKENSDSCKKIMASCPPDQFGNFAQ